MKFRWTVIISILAHVGLFSLVYLKPSNNNKSAMTYYVDLVQMPGGGDGRLPGGRRGGPGKQAREDKPPEATENAKIKDLVVAKPQDPDESSLRVPSEKKEADAKKPKKPEVEKKQQFVSVVHKKDEPLDPSAAKNSANQKAADGKDDSFVRIGVGREGNGNGQGNGQGDGVGDGDGLGLGFGPGAPGGGYNYYYAVIQNKIKNAWYNTAMRAGLDQKVAYIACRILRNGQIDDVRVYQGSGDEALDTSGLRAVRRAAPFPPMPANNTNTYIDVIFEFEGRKR